MRLPAVFLLATSACSAAASPAIQEQHFYVSNKDAGGTTASQRTGSINNPFRSIFEARDALRRHSDTRESGPRFVHLQGGTHELKETFALDPVLDSGTPESPIVYTSYPGERATLSGGTVLPASAFTDTVINGNVSVKAVNLFNFGINSTTIGELGHPYPSANLELFFGGRAMTRAREPNIGSLEDPTMWNWCGYENMTGPLDPAGTLQFGFADTERAEYWAKSLSTGSMWFHGFWKFDWRDTYVEVDSIVRASPSEYHVTVSPNTPPQYTFTKGSRFYAVGHIALLDAPGEYHVNSTTGQLYFYPPVDGGFDTGTQIVVSTLPSALQVPSGTSDVSFTDMTIEVSQGTTMDLGSVTGVQVHNCTVRSAGEACLSIAGTNNSVTASTIAECGRSGISTSGGDFHSLTPQNISIVGNYVANTSRIVRTYNPGIAFSTVGGYYANNTIFNSPHTAMTGSSNNGLFEYNRIIKASYECTDTGAFYVGRSWSQRGNVARYNYFQDVKATERLAQKSCSQNAFYLDDEMSGWEFYGNTIVNCTTGVLLGGGRRNVIRDNVFIGNLLDVEFDNRGMTWQTEYCVENCTGTACFKTELESVNYTHPPYSVEYPELLTIYSDRPCVPVHNVITGNVYCHANSPTGAQFINQKDSTIASWNSSINNNTNVCP